MWTSSLGRPTYLISRPDKSFEFYLRRRMVPVEIILMEEGALARRDEFKTVLGVRPFVC